jgi:hypothetical protein
MNVAFPAWAVKLLKPDGYQLAVLRHWPGLQIAQDVAGLWIRGHWNDAANDRELKAWRHQLLALWNVEHFHVTADHQLVPFGKRVPTGWLPDLDWQPLQNAIDFDWPLAGLAGRSLQPLRLHLVRGASRFHPIGTRPEVLLCELKHLLPWVIAAPLRRLAGLQFACDPSQRLLVKGPILPSIPGLAFSLQAALAVPLGWHWEPELTPETIQQVFSPAAGSMVVWFPDNGWEEVPDHCFQTLTRAALRATANRFLQPSASGVSHER